MADFAIFSVFTGKNGRNVRATASPMGRTRFGSNAQKQYRPVGMVSIGKIVVGRMVFVAWATDALAQIAIFSSRKQINKQ